MMTGPKSLGIYVQVPFCQTKCTYCHFHTGPFARSMYSAYADAICREVELVCEDESAKWQSRTVDTVYIGGGTPSLLETSALRQILDALRNAFACAWHEVTLEADPETISREKAEQWRGMGMNRVSLGVQSFHDTELHAAGRRHRRADIFAAFDQLRAAGFENISADLIAGLPYQTENSWKESIEQLVALHPEHISIYLLEVDSESRLGREVLAGGTKYGAAQIPSDEVMAACYEFACERLSWAGYEHYEISNWAWHPHGEFHPRLDEVWWENPIEQSSEWTFESGFTLLPDPNEIPTPQPRRGDSRFRSQHNLKYWRRQPYLGLGAGAHSFDGASRWANDHDPATYIAAIRNGSLLREQCETLTPALALDEELFLGLRLLEGIDVSHLEQKYNVKLADRLVRLRDSGWLEMHGKRARIAPSRLAVSNEVFVELMG